MQASSLHDNDYSDIEIYYIYIFILAYILMHLI